MVKYYISSANKTLPTVRQLSRALNHNGIFPKFSRWDRYNKRVKYLVRYGSTRQFREVINELNSIEAITLASHKYNARQKIEEAGVRVPQYSLNPYGIAPPIIRRPLRHARCINFKYYPDEDSVEDDYRGSTEGIGYYFQRYIPQKKEYRLHMFRDEPLRIQVKYPRLEQLDPIKRGMKFGWGFKIRNTRPTSDKLIDMCKQTMKSLSLDFGAIDALLGEDRKFYILEVNTAPGLNASGAEIYADRIQQWIEES